MGNADHRLNFCVTRGRERNRIGCGNNAAACAAANYPARTSVLARIFHVQYLSFEISRKHLPLHSMLLDFKTSHRWDEVTLKTRAGLHPPPLRDEGEIAGALGAGR